MSKPRFSTVCKQAKGLMERIPNKTGMIQNMIDSFPKAAEIFFAEGMYWEIYEYGKKYPDENNSFDALKRILAMQRSLPQEVYQSIEIDGFTPYVIFLCGQKAERAILSHQDVVDAMKDYQLHIFQDINANILRQREEGFVNVYDEKLTRGERHANKGKIIELLKETGNKKVVNELIPALNNTTFFTKARCNSHHNIYDGALAQHSLGVCLNALELAGNSIEREKVILTGLLHDLCDIHHFKDKNNNPVHAIPGHGSRSRDILKKLKLGIDDEVLNVIRHHLGPSRRSESDKRKNDKIWASSLFSVLHVADHMDAGRIHCFEIGNTGAESYVSLDCSNLHDRHEFRLLKRDIESLATRYNIQLKKNKYGGIDWNKKRCSMRVLEFGEKGWNQLVPLTEACRQITHKVKKTFITVSKIALNKNNLVLVAEMDNSLIALRDQLQSLFNYQGHSLTFTKNLTIKIAEFSDASGNKAKLVEELNSSVSRYQFEIDAINLHYYKGSVAGVYYFK